MRARAVPGGPGPGAILFPIRSRRRSGPRRWCGRWRRSAPRSSRSAAGEVFFAVDGLRGIHGGDGAGVLAAASEALGAARRSRERRRVAPPRIGAAPTRFAAFAAAGSGEVPRVDGAGSHGFLAPLPVALLRAAPRRSRGARGGRAGRDAASGSGSGRWGSSRGSRADQVADRFGPLGLRALRTRPRRGRAAAPAPPARGAGRARSSCRKGPPGSQLDRALELLVDRLLAAPQRRGPHPARAAPRGAALRRRQLERRAGAGPAERLGRGPAPAAGAAAGGAAGAGRRRCGCGRSASARRPRDQLELAVGGEEPRRRRLGEAVREVRAAQGAEALLRILPVDSASRVPGALGDADSLPRALRAG